MKNNEVIVLLIVLMNLDFQRYSIIKYLKFLFSGSNRVLSKICIVNYGQQYVLPKSG